MPSLLIFGNQQTAIIAHHYFETDSEYDVVAFVVDQEFLTDTQLQGLPVYSLERAIETFSPYQFEFFIAIGYSKMNQAREHAYLKIKNHGYKLASYVSSRCTWLSDSSPGDNCMILENNTIQPFSQIGNNVTLWSGNHLGHHSTIEDHCFVSSHVVISGNVQIGHHCFLGVNATITDGINVAPYTLLGAGVTITKDTKAHGVYVPPKATSLEKASDQFL